MGNCFSDVEGGKQAVGGAQQRPNSIATTTNNNGGHNDAVEFFFRSRGIQPLFTQIEVIYVKYKVQKRQSQKLFQYFVTLLYVQLYQKFPLHNTQNHILYVYGLCYCLFCTPIWVKSQSNSVNSYSRSKFWVFF